MSKLFNVRVALRCDCHYLDFCTHHLLDAVVGARDAEQITNVIALRSTKYDVTIFEQEPLSLSELVRETNEIKERYD